MQWETPFEADLLISDGLIEKIGHFDARTLPNVEVIPCEGCLVLPGFVQSHVHLAQTLFRGMAEGLDLLRWLSQRIWPLEAAHDPDTLYASARAGLAELLLSGCTALLDMGSVRHMESIFEASKEMGVRLTSGKIMMDRGKAVPSPLKDSTSKALDESLSLWDTYHLKANGRIRYAITPRFLLSCSPDLMRKSLTLAFENDLLWHTHVAEQVAEIHSVMEETGKESIVLLQEWGAAKAQLCLAHMIHLSAKEKRILRDLRIGVAHCPTANTKLGSGVCKVPDLLSQGVAVGLGSDGSPCNNRLDMFQEMRMAAALQNLTVGPGTLTSRTLLSMATLMGARVLGIDRLTGSLHEGKHADVTVLDFNGPTFVHGAEVYDAIVHHGDARSVKHVFVDGRWLVKDGKLTMADEQEIARDAAKAIKTIRQRAMG